MVLDLIEEDAEVDAGVLTAVDEDCEFTEDMANEGDIEFGLGQRVLDEAKVPSVAQGWRVVLSLGLFGAW